MCQSDRRTMICQRGLLILIVICYTTIVSVSAHQNTPHIGAFSTPPILLSSFHNAQRIPRSSIAENCNHNRRRTYTFATTSIDEIESADTTISTQYKTSEDDTFSIVNESRDIGDQVLSSVESLARSVGSAGNNLVSDPSSNGKKKSLFNVRRPSVSQRGELIQWQRDNLQNRKFDEELEEEGSILLEEREFNRMSALIAALPSRRRRRANRRSSSNVSKAEEISSGTSQEPPKSYKGNKESSSSKSSSSKSFKSEYKKDSTLITTALETLERNMALLDNVASSQSQLSGTEVGLLLGAVFASGVGPIAFPGTSVTELLAPAAAAFTASVTIGSEYIGRVAVADGKEIAANTIQCAAEAEAFLANAERVKAISPLCVGIGATCAALSLLAPAIIEAMNLQGSVIMLTEIYLFCPLVSVLAAAVANLALEETKGFAARAVNVGVRRFSKRSMVGQTWLSTSEQVQRNSKSKTDRWWYFAGSVLPAPIVGSLVGGPSLSAKCIVIASLAAAQSAYFLAQAEGVVARATDAVALKARSAAVCDTYANQGARNSAILPFTSALSAFCAAATAATVELPFLDTVSALYGTVGEVALVSLFPILSSTFAAAAAVSKARCEVDAEAAAQAASTLALEYDTINSSGGDPVLRPFQAVKELMRLAVTSGWRSIKKTVINPFKNSYRVWRSTLLGFKWRYIRRWKEGKGNGTSTRLGGEERIAT